MLKNILNPRKIAIAILQRIVAPMLDITVTDNRQANEPIVSETE